MAFHKVLRISDHKVITFGEMIDDVRKADIVLVGETHDSMKDHAAELDVIQALHDRNATIGIGLEMFRADSQKSLDEWSSGTLDEAKFIRIYYNNWRMPWPYYGDILLYARNQAIPIVGLNVPDAVSRKVATTGFASLTPAERALLPPGISCNVDPRYMEFIRRVYETHGAQDDTFVHFCEAQMVWDKSMAWHLIGYMKKHPGRKMVVLSGTGHAWKRGIPEQLKELSSYSYKVVLPQVPDERQRSSITTSDADYIFLD